MNEKINHFTYMNWKITKRALFISLFFAISSKMLQSHVLYSSRKVSKCHIIYFYTLTKIITALPYITNTFQVDVTLIVIKIYCPRSFHYYGLFSSLALLSPLINCTFWLSSFFFTTPSLFSSLSSESSSDSISLFNASTCVDTLS